MSSPAPATTAKPNPNLGKSAEKPKPFVIDTTHRCDRCGESSQAYYRVVLKDSGLDLLFCGHHYEQYKFVLFDLIDHEQTLNEYGRLDTGNRLVGSENS